MPFLVYIIVLYKSRGNSEEDTKQNLFKLYHEIANAQIRSIKFCHNFLTDIKHFFS